MRVQFLHSTVNANGSASKGQHLTTMVVDDLVAFDAGSLAMACTDRQRESIRDVVLSHAHLDHIAGLPLFIDDLFSQLTEPVRIHAEQSVIDVLEENIFNWKVYPKFSELNNEVGAVVEYRRIEPGSEFKIKHISVRAIEVSHKVPSCGFIISNNQTTIATTGDTAPTDEFWSRVNALPSINAVLVECAFPSHLGDLAAISHHLTPKSLRTELEKLHLPGASVYVVNIKPAFRERTVREIEELKDDRLEILEIGKVYEW